MVYSFKSNNLMKNYTFGISGTHCTACKMLLEDILGEETDIRNVQVNLEDKTLTLEGEVIDTKKLVDSLNSQITSYGYEVSTMEHLEKQTRQYS